MHGRQRQFLLLWAWMLTVLLPFQPLLVVACSCDCHHSTPCSRTECDSERHDYGLDGNGCCHEHRSHVTLRGDEGDRVVCGWTFRMAPHRLSLPTCNCPDDCGCQAQHQSRLGIRETTNVQVDRNESDTRAGSPSCSIATTGLSAFYHWQGRNERPTLATCVALCRFII